MLFRQIIVFKSYLQEKNGLSPNFFGWNKFLENFWYFWKFFKLKFSFLTTFNLIFVKSWHRLCKPKNLWVSKCYGAKLRPPYGQAVKVSFAIFDEGLVGNSQLCEYFGWFQIKWTIVQETTWRRRIFGRLKLKEANSMYIVSIFVPKIVIFRFEVLFY